MRIPYVSFESRFPLRHGLFAAVAVMSALIGRGPLGAEPPTTPPDEIEFFEKRVRPLLVQRCHKCHGPDEHEGGLRLDSRKAVLDGGETGPAIVPGEPEQSELVRAIRYEPDGYQMPPDGKLRQQEIDALTKWVAMGAPWPDDTSAADDRLRDEEAFDLAERAAHWSFQPLTRPAIPPVVNPDWCRTPIDRFLLARLELEGLTPAPEADRRTWLRRVSLDISGLPPTEQELRAFLDDDSPVAYEQVVDRLLASPHFGERWGRHWLDLVRYAESRGHEHDYDVANPWHYRDYVIRALNDDVPYNQFVIEHIAGDLLPASGGRQSPDDVLLPASSARKTPDDAVSPSDVPFIVDPIGGLTSPARRSLRLHPLTGANESILATGFWYLGEWVHSPVDIRQDEADRFENMLDVYSKTFLGLTVACARCHDHKFDPITQRDYYALQGYLQSSAYRQVRFETMEHNRRIAQELETLRRQAAEDIMPLLAELVEPVVDDLDVYLVAARDLIQAGVETYPVQDDIVFADFESGTYDGWELEGDAFGTHPQTLKTKKDDQHENGGVSTSFVTSYRAGAGGRGDAHIGVMTSQPFVIDRSFIRLDVAGGAHEGRTCVLLLVEDDIPHAATGQNDDVLRTVTWDVRPDRGKRARIRIIDNEKGPWGHINIDHIVFTDEPPSEVPPLSAESFVPSTRARIEAKANELLLAPTILGNWVGHLLTAGQDESDPFYLWAAYATGRLSEIDDVHTEAKRLLKHYHSVRYRSSHESTVRSFDMTPEPSISWRHHRLEPFTTFPLDGTPWHEPPFFTEGWWEFNRDLPTPQVADESDPEPGATGSFSAGLRLRTPTLGIASGSFYCLVRGGVNTYVAVDSHVLVQGPLHGSLVREHPSPDAKGWRWIKLDVSRYSGHRAHIEFAPRPGEDLAIALVVQSAELPPEIPVSAPTAPSTQRLGWLSEGCVSDRGLARRLQENFGPARVTIGGGFTGPPEQLYLLLEYGYVLKWHDDWITRHPHLFVTKRPYYEDLGPTELVRELHLPFNYNFGVRDFRCISAVAPAMIDVSGEDEYVFIRGNWQKRGEVVPRRFLEVFGGEQMPRPDQGSGRLALAEWMVDPQVTPILPRVIVNRIWQHYFGRGIVPTPDDFGHMGRPPSHPELLDWLASELVESRWSLKHIHRLILHSAAYRMSSAQLNRSKPRPLGRGPVADARGSDVENRWLSRMNIKRLEGEIIRDAMLAVSGRLDERMYGPSVPVHLTPFMEGRGRPEQSGPVDGAGRRSLYIAVRRNFPHPFFQAFDMPTPHSTVGLRTVSNVPAQALALMNNPLVIEQARAWAKRLLRETPPGSLDERINRMYISGFSRPPTDEERAAAQAFLTSQAAEFETTTSDIRVWTDLCHVLLGAKEFLFVQ